ncbi:MAG TPA: ATP12 family protein [Ferrovibrio sp.]|uniref:ATP12 family chaperone protein n=1 Tax=Ferrovibrio sp. TaxID=1917215 RepID=UPI002ED3BCAF
MKRSYKSVTTGRRADGSYEILLDDRPLKTPAKADLALPSRSLAEAIAAEWQAQEGDIKPLQMPLTRLIATAIDRIAVDPSAAIAEIVRYGDTDLLSHWAESPQELVTRQASIWQPLLDWFRARYDAQFHVTQGIIAVTQPETLKPRLESICSALTPLQLTALHAATTTTSSVVIGLALLEGRLDAEAAHRASLLDELYQAELWGEDAEAAARRAALLTDLQNVAEFLSRSNAAE